MKKLIDIQSELKAPKNNFNSFGKYNFRSCEDILESLKPILKKYSCIINLTDDIVNLGNRFYVKAIAKIIDIETKEEMTSIGFAREPENKKGFDESQLTGSCSSYARKYALSGLLALDDSKDADNYDNSKLDKAGKDLDKAIGGQEVKELVDKKTEIINRARQLYCKKILTEQTEDYMYFSTLKENHTLYDIERYDRDKIKLDKLEGVK